MTLVKPQFEAGREQVGKKGIVRDRAVHQAVIEKIIRLAASLGYDVVNLSHSPITGGDGNIEFLLHIRWPGEEKGGNICLPVTPEQAVTASHEEFNQKS
jgi:23S rRNA (cytidine1920-2'-O)/16S rRNA (cytidine1409-2'-O)-methyltransferase